MFVGTATTFSSSSFNGYSNSAPDFRDNGMGDALVMESFQELSSTVRINSSWGVTTALAFGLAITVLAYATAHLSGGQLNPAVSLGLALVKAISPMQMVVNIIAQIVGAILGAAFLDATIPDGSEGALGSNQISPGVGYGNALAGEIIMTAVLVAVVLETAVNKRNEIARSQAPLAIGFAVFCAHAVLLPIDGCSINPARSLGPAIVSGTWPGTFWVFIVGPFLGALAAVPAHLFFRSKFEETDPDEQDPIDFRSLEAGQTSTKTADQ
jgi:MIP family channel proteins